MISWKLWQALKHPPEAHPVYQRTLATYRKQQRTIPRQPTKQEKSSFQINNTARRLLILLALIAGGWFTAQGGWLILAPTLALLGLTPFFTNVLGTQLAIQVSCRIIQERQQGTYDLLNLTPSGTLGIGWAFANGYIHHDQRFKDIWRIFEPIGLSSIIMLAFAIIFGVMNTINPSLYDGLFELSPFAKVPELPLLYLGGIGAITAAFTEITHGISMAIMLGILVPESMRGIFNGYIAALSTFLGLQAIIYVLTLAMRQVILPIMFRTANIPNLIADVGAATVMLATFCILRLGINALLWRAMMQHLNVDVNEVKMVLQ